MITFHQSFVSAPSPLHRAWSFIRRRKWTVSAIVLVLFSFYWFQIRPVSQYRACAVQASTDARILLKNKSELAKGTKNEDAYKQMVAKNMYLRSDYESFLKKCLLYYGLTDDVLKACQDSSNQGVSEPLGKQGQVSKN